jgi:hypothetical protein
MMRTVFRFAMLAGLLPGCSSPSPSSASSRANLFASPDASAPNGLPIWSDGDAVFALTEQGGDTSPDFAECAQVWSITWTYEATSGQLDKSGCEDGVAITKSLALAPGQRSQLETALRAARTDVLVTTGATDCMYDGPFDSAIVTRARGDTKAFHSTPWCGDSSASLPGPITDALLGLSSLMDSMAGCPATRGEWCSSSCSCAAGLTCQTGNGSPACHSM